MLIAFDNSSISHDRLLPNCSSLQVKENILYLSKVVTIKLGLSIYSYQLIKVRHHVWRRMCEHVLRMVTARLIAVALTSSVIAGS